MTDAEALQLAQDLADIAAAADEELNDLTLGLTREQAERLGGFITTLTGLSNAIATAGALAALQASAPQFASIKQATTAANAAATALKADATRLNSMFALLGNAVTFGSALTGGALGTVIAAAAALATSASRV